MLAYIRDWLGGKRLKVQIPTNLVLAILIKDSHNMEKKPLLIVNMIEKSANLFW